MQNDKTLQVINELRQVLSSNFEDFRGAYFYGSRVKGNHQSDSDFDIVAIFDEVNRDKRMNIWGFVGKIEAQYDVFIDLHPMTMQELKKNPVYHDQVVNNGIYYAAA